MTEEGWQFRGSILWTILLSLLTILVADYGINSGHLTSYIIFLTNENRGFFSVLLSGLLVLLYYEQHRVQRRQTSILDRQADIQELQTDINYSNQLPHLRVKSFEIMEDVGISEYVDQENLKGNIDQLGFELDVKNHGSGPAHNINLAVDLLLSFEEFGPGCYSSELFGIKIDEYQLGEDDEKLGPTLYQENGTTLREGSRGLFFTFINLLHWWADDHGVSSLGFQGLVEAINSNVLSIDHLVVHSYIEYEDSMGEKYQTTIQCHKVDYEQVDTFYNTISHGELLAGADFQIGDYEKILPYLTDEKPTP